MSSKPRAEIPTLELYTWDNGLAKIRRHIHETTNQDYKIHDLDQGSPKGDQDRATWVEVPGKKRDRYHGTTHNIEEARLEGFNSQCPSDTILVEIGIHQHNLIKARDITTKDEAPSHNNKMIGDLESKHNNITDVSVGFD